MHRRTRSGVQPSGNADTVDVAVYGRTYKFVDKVHGGRFWVEQINKYFNEKVCVFECVHVNVFGGQACVRVCL